MKNYFHYSFVLVLIGSLLASCSVSNFSVEKRRYRKGFHVSSSEQRTGEKIASESAKLEKAKVSFNTEAIAQTPNSVIAAEQTAEITPAVSESFTVAPMGVVTVKEGKQFTESNGSVSVAEKIQVRALKKAVKNSQKSPFDQPDKVLLVILAILLPPLAVYLHQGEVNGKFWLNIVLTLLCGLPGVIHALIVVLRD